MPVCGMRDGEMRAYPPLERILRDTGFDLATYEGFIELAAAYRDPQLKAAMLSEANGMIWSYRASHLRKKTLARIASLATSRESG